jgi:peptide/nickel transport system permease protein
MRTLALRVVHSFISLLAISLLCFGLLHAAPGDYFTELRLEPGISQKAIKAMESQSDLSRPLVVRYALWCKSVLHGDFGNSLAYRLPVGPLVRERIGNTLMLGAAGLFGAWALGFVLGSMRGWLATATRSLAALLWAIPEPVLALVLLIAALKLHTLAPMPGIGAEDESSWTHFRSLSRQIALPALAMALGYLPVVLRHVQRGLDAARNAPAVEAARIHGFAYHRIFLDYILPEAANPLISLFGLGIGSLLSASLFVEVLFGWPGLGQLLLSAILARDTNIVVAGVLCSAVILIAGNLLADVLLWVQDPRIREEGL